MIIKGASRCCAWWWARHFEDTQENERVRLVKSEGLASENIYDLICEMRGHAQGTNAKNFMWVALLNPGPNERLTEQGWEKAREILEKHRGYQGQPYFVVEHEKKGYIHRHMVWSRIDTEHMRALPDGLDAKLCHAAAREIERELGLQRVVGPFDREPGTPRPKRAPEAWEMYRGMKTRIDPREITAEVTRLFHQSDTGKAFHAALENHGYPLVTGRRGLLILDSAGNEHSLARRIDGINTKRLNAFMRDVDRAALPTLEQGKAQYQQRKIDGLEADRATVRREIQWEEALATAAIEKEKTDRRFIDPEKKRAEPAGRREERKWPIMPPRPESRHRTEFEQAAKDSGHDRRPENLKGAAARIWDIWNQSHTSKAPDADRVWPNARQSYSLDAKAFAAALDRKGIAFAVVTKEEAERSHREAAFAKALGNYAPRYKEGEMVAVSTPLEYRRKGEIVKPHRVHKLDQSLAGKFVAALGGKDRLQGIDATKKVLDVKAQERAAHWQDIRLGNATRTRGSAPVRRNRVKLPPIVTKVPLRTVGKAMDFVGNAFGDLFAPKLTPEQKHEGEKAKLEREAQAEHSIDFSKYTALRAHDLQRQEQEQEAELLRKRDRGGRER